MRFANPEALFLLIVLLPFVFLVIYNSNRKKKLLAEFVSATAFARLGARSGKEIGFFKAALVTAALCFFILALAEPEWGEVFESVDIKGIEMLFLMDTSNSMNAEDLKPNRLEVAKQLITGVVDNFNTDYVGLINFAGAPYVQCPLTIDYEAFKLMVEASLMSPDEEQGTDFAAAFNLALRTFKSSPDSRKIVILLTDGEDQEKKWQQALAGLREQKVIFFSVGVGVASGAPIPLKNDKGEVTGWKKDNQGNIVRTKLDEQTLIEVAASTGGQYFRLTDPSAIDLFIANLKAFERDVLAQKVRLKRVKRFYIPLLLGIILLVSEMFLTEKRLKWLKNS
jgi:Ca-activated chloride channel family protein